MTKLRKAWVILLIFICLLLPGLIPLIRLHPYQYVYYNSLIGGVSGANGRFEMDYWETSYAEAMRYINQVAPAHSKILVWTVAEVAVEYNRPDLVVVSRSLNDAGPFKYVLISSRGDKNVSVFPEFPVIFDVQRDGVVFSVVKAGSQ